MRVNRFLTVGAVVAAWVGATADRPGPGASDYLQLRKEGTELLYGAFFTNKEACAFLQSKLGPLEGFFWTLIEVAVINNFQNTCGQHLLPASESARQLDQTATYFEISDEPLTTAAEETDEPPTSSPPPVLTLNQAARLFAQYITQVGQAIASGLQHATGSALMEADHVRPSPTGKDFSILAHELICMLLDRAEVKDRWWPDAKTLLDPFVQGLFQVLKYCAENQCTLPGTGLPTASANWLPIDQTLPLILKASA